MKTVKFFGAFILAATMLLACGDAPEVEVTTPEVQEEVKTGPSGLYGVDAEKSSIAWEGNMMKVAGTSLYSHTGTLTLAEGKIQVENGEISGGGIIVDMTTLATTDDEGNYDSANGKGRDALVGQLSSPDFFDVASYPTASFEITGYDGSSVSGKLTIRGVSQDAKATVTNMTVGANDLKLTATMQFDRQAFGVAFSMANAMDVRDKFIDDTITMNITLAGTAK
jgi:polyisoprenoid-binding protein YceI